MSLIEPQAILDAFNFRHACKEFDSSKKIPEEQFDLILDAINLSPSSFGLEPWKFLVIQNTALREQIKAHAWGGQKQLPTASHVIVALHKRAKELRFDGPLFQQNMFDRRDMPVEMEQAYRRFIQEFQEKDFELLGNDEKLDDWAGKQTYIALGNMLTVAAMLGIDSCPMEGFNRTALSELLQQECQIDPAEYRPAYLVGFGYRVNPQPNKIRCPKTDVIEWF